MSPNQNMAQPDRNLPIYELISPDGIKLIHERAMEVLGKIGIDFYLEEAREILQDHGVRVEGETAYFDDPDLVMEYVSKAPSEFTLLARNPENNLTVGGDNTIFAPVYGPPFVYDTKHGRREATQEDFDNFVKMAYMCPYMHHSGGTILEAGDVPDETRYLHMLKSHIQYSDKSFMGPVMAGKHAADAVKIVEMLHGADAVRENPALISLINISSPRRLDDRMLESLIEYARARQAVIITPFIIAGAMSPVSLAGTLIQQNAEALAGIAFSQMVEEGAPVVYGSFMTNADMRTGAPVFGSPESHLAILNSAQMARFYDLPFRSGGMFTSSKLTDTQAAYESMMTMLPAIYGQVNFVLHAAGWLENGMAAGYEKFVLDCEILGMIHTMLNGVDLSEEAQAMDSLRSVEPGGHHLGTQHTMRHFRDAFYIAELFDYQDVDIWEMDGGTSATDRAAAKVERMLAEYTAPEIDPKLMGEIESFIAQRSEELLADTEE